MKEISKAALVRRERVLEQALSALKAKNIKPTWANIGRELGISRQAAQARFKTLHTSIPQATKLLAALQGVDTATLTLAQIVSQYAPDMTTRTVYQALARHGLTHSHRHQLLDELRTNLAGADTSHLTVNEIGDIYKPEGMSDVTFKHHLHSKPFRQRNGVLYKRSRATKGEAFLNNIKGIDLSGMTSKEIVGRFCPENMKRGTLMSRLGKPSYRAKHNLVIKIKTRQSE